MDPEPTEQEDKSVSGLRSKSSSSSSSTSGKDSSANEEEDDKGRSRRTMSTRRVKIADASNSQPTERTKRELAKLGDHNNPLMSLADWIREKAEETKTIAAALDNNEEEELTPQTINEDTQNEESSKEDDPDEQSGGEETMAAFALVDGFGGETGQCADTAFSATDIDPTTFKDIFKKPRTHDEAWNHPDQFQREQWRAAIAKELNKMEEK